MRFECSSRIETRRMSLAWSVASCVNETFRHLLRATISAGCHRRATLVSLIWCCLSQKRITKPRPHSFHQLPAHEGTALHILTSSHRPRQLRSARTCQRLCWLPRCGLSESGRIHHQTHQLACRGPVASVKTWATGDNAIVQLLQACRLHRDDAPERPRCLREQHACLIGLDGVQQLQKHGVLRDRRCC